MKSSKMGLFQSGKSIFSKAVAGAILTAGALPAFAATTPATTPASTNLSSLVPTSFIGSWFWAAAGLVIGAVVAVKGVQVIIRLIRRV